METKSRSAVETKRVSTGVSGFDEVVDGGFIAGNTYLLSGAPGTGKTTLGWHFLTAAEHDESALYVTFAEPQAALRTNAAASGFDIGRVHIVDLSPSADVFARGEVYDLFSSSEIEREPTTARIVEAIKTFAPKRIFVDSMTSLRFLTNDAFQFRRQALSFLRFLAADGATVVVTSESTEATPDDELRFIVDGVIHLEMTARTWSLSVSKFRGSRFRKGVHGMVLGAKGASVYPRLLPENFAVPAQTQQLQTGNATLDRMLGGGLEAGTVTILSGPTGVGKTTLGIQILARAARAGRPVTMYTFDERRETVERRCTNIGIPVGPLIEANAFRIRTIEPLRFGADEFAAIVRRDIEDSGTAFVMIDSISGYRMTIEGDDLIERIHALGRYLQNVGVNVLLIDELLDFGEFRATGVGISYLADNLIFMRYIETSVDGGLELGRAIGVLKKRLSDFEKGVRAFDITSHGVVVGERVPWTTLFSQTPGRNGRRDE